MLDKKLTDLSNYRFEKAKETLKNAQTLYHDRGFNASINRSYYAMFSAIRSLLALIEKDSASHSGVISMFNRYFVKTGLFDKKWSKIIQIAFEIRQDSDYKDFYQATEIEANDQLTNAFGFLDEVESLRNRLSCDQLKLPNIT